MDADFPALFDYRLDWRPSSRWRGEHLAVGAGAADLFRGHRPLIDAADARRIDVRAGLTDPLARWWVRETEARAGIAWWLLLDLSASVFDPHGAERASTCRLIAELCASCALSTYRAGDRFGLFAAAARPIDPLCLPAQRRPASARALAARLRDPDQLARIIAQARTPVDSAHGLTDAVARIGATRAVVLIASDFYGDAAHWSRLFTQLAAHQLVPLVLRDGRAANALPRAGLLRLRDAETGRQRTVLLRPAMQRRIRELIEQNDQALAALFTRYRLRPMRLGARYQARRFTEYFAGA